MWSTCDDNDYDNDGDDNGDDGDNDDDDDKDDGIDNDIDDGDDDDVMMMIVIIWYIIIIYIIYLELIGDTKSFHWCWTFTTIGITFVGFYSKLSGEWEGISIVGRWIVKVDNYYYHSHHHHHHYK